ncbi:MAG: hypothetical protein WC997_06235 [Porticoccaceae bacterium]
MTILSPQEYRQLAGPVAGSGYSALPPALLAAERAVADEDRHAAFALNRDLCRALLEDFTLADARWSLPARFRALYDQQLVRIASNVARGRDDYFSLANDPFRKDLAILRHRLIPCGAELATPFAGIPRNLLLKGGWRQSMALIQAIARCRGIQPLLELHMHPHCTASFNPGGWIDTYENLADLLALNSDFLGVQSTSWFLDPALENISPHLCYLREVPQRCGAVILYAGEDDPDTSAALVSSNTRRTLFAAGRYHPRLFTRIWPRRKLLQRTWRALSTTEDGNPQ